MLGRIIKRSFGFLGDRFLFRARQTSNLVNIPHSSTQFRHASNFCRNGIIVELFNLIGRLGYFFF